MGDKVGTIPDIYSQRKALEEILHISKDKRSHVLKDDCISWFELKMKVIRKIAKTGLAINEHK